MKPTIKKRYMFLLMTKKVWAATSDTYSDVENSSQIFELTYEVLVV